MPRFLSYRMWSREGNQGSTVRKFSVSGVGSTWNKCARLDFSSVTFLLGSLRQTPEVNSKVRCRAQGLGKVRVGNLPGPWEKPSAYGNVLKSSGSQSVIPRPSASPEGLLETQIFRPQPSPPELTACVLTDLPGDSEACEYLRTAA